LLDLTLSLGVDYDILYNCPNSGYPPQYCCSGDPTSCCSNKSYFNVPAGTLILRPFQLATIAAGSSPTVAAGPSPTSSVNSLNPTSLTPTTPSKSSNSPSAESIGIGLGVGIPLGLALLAILGLLYRELRKRNRPNQNNTFNRDSGQKENLIGYSVV
jgi:hypothetical protein